MSMAPLLPLLGERHAMSMAPLLGTSSAEIHRVAAPQLRWEATIHLAPDLEVFGEIAVSPNTMAVGLGDFATMVLLGNVRPKDILETARPPF